MIEKKIIAQNYPLRKTIWIASSLLLTAVGCAALYEFAMLIITKRIAEGESPYIYIFPFSASSPDNRAFLVATMVFAGLIVLYIRVIFPELSSKIKAFQKNGRYTASKSNLSISLDGEETVYRVIDKLEILYPRYYDPSNSAWGVIPKRTMMDGKITISGKSGECSIYFFDDHGEETAEIEEMANDILLSFDDLILDKALSTLRKKVYNRCMGKY